VAIIGKIKSCAEIVMRIGKRTAYNFLFLMTNLAEKAINIMPRTDAKLI